jgi:DNA mismatch repair protein MutS2
MLAELSTSRAQLETEQQRAATVRAESEAARDEYRARLVRLQEQRDALYRHMREDLDAAFKRAHTDVASVIRDLQRGPTAQQAAAAREQLQALEARARQAEEAAGLEPDAPPAHLSPVDWRRIAAGDLVRIDGVREAVLLSLPDRRGRVGVRAGGARLVLPAARIGLAAPPGSSDEKSGRSGTRARVTVERAHATADVLGGGRLRCDLRGRRVEEALDELAGTLDRAAADGCNELFVVHGVGTGALRQAIREHLAGSRLVTRVCPGSEDEGGDGVTLAQLGD